MRKAITAAPDSPSVNADRTPAGAKNTAGIVGRGNSVASQTTTASAADADAAGDIIRLGGRMVGIDNSKVAPAVDPPVDVLTHEGIVSPSGTHVVKQIEDRLVVEPKKGKPGRQWPVARSAGEMPVWSRDGRYLAFAGFRCASGTLLGVLDVENDLLFRVGGSQIGGPKWSPDGSELTVVVRRRGRGEVWSLKTMAVTQSPPLAPACACPDIPQATAELIGPWRRPRVAVFAIDLSRHYNTPKQGHDDDNTLDLPAGNRLLAGVEFRIGERMMQVQGQRSANMPSAINGIPVHHQVVRLYILHATEYGQESQGVKEGELIAEYRVRYADGEVATVPVNIGQDVRDWWTSQPTPLARGQVAWAGKNKRASNGGCYVRLYLSTWRNPYPEKTVDCIDYVAMNGIAAPFCLAISAEGPRRLDAQAHR